MKEYLVKYSRYRKKILFLLKLFLRPILFHAKLSFDNLTYFNYTVILSTFPGIRRVVFDCKSKGDDKAGLPNAKISVRQMKWVSFRQSCTDRSLILLTYKFSAVNVQVGNSCKEATEKSHQRIFPYYFQAKSRYLH